MSETSKEESEKPIFEIGDIVVLKSGGPDMAISQVIKKGERWDNAEHYLYCVNWFDEKRNPVSDTFLEPMLKKSSEPKSSGFNA